MKTILITGANRGLGLEMTRQFQQEGDWHIIACCREPEKATELHALAENPSSSIEILPLDVRDVQSMESLKKNLDNRAIDVLMNNAGILGVQGEESFGKFYQSSKDAPEIFQVNVLGVLFLSELLVDNVARSQTKIIANISSEAGSMSLDRTGEACLYCASKAALNSITKSMAATLKDRGIAVIAIHPGWVKTDMGGPNAHIMPKDSIAGIKHTIKRVTLADSGTFIKYSGETMPW